MAPCGIKYTMPTGIFQPRTPNSRPQRGQHRPCSDEQLRLSFRSKNTQIVGNKRSLIPVANTRLNGGFRTIDSPFVKIPPQIERTCAVRPSQIPFSGEFSTPESEFVTENGGCTAKNGHGLYDCPKTEKRRQPRAPLRKPIHIKRARGDGS